MKDTKIEEMRHLEETPHDKALHEFFNTLKNDGNLENVEWEDLTDRKDLELLWKLLDGKLTRDEVIARADELHENNRLAGEISVDFTAMILTKLSLKKSRLHNAPK